MADLARLELAFRRAAAAGDDAAARQLAAAIRAARTETPPAALTPLGPQQPWAPPSVDTRGATLSAPVPPMAPAPTPSALSRAKSALGGASRYAQETGLDTMTGVARMGGLLDPAYALAGAAVQKLGNPDETRPFVDVWDSEARKFGGGLAEIDRRSPSAPGVGGVLGTALAAGAPGAASAMAPMSAAASEAVPVISRGAATISRLPLLTRAAAGAGDAALLNAGRAALMNPADPGTAANEAAYNPANLMAALGVTAQEVYPVARAIAAEARQAGNQARIKTLGVTPADAKVMREKYGSIEGAGENLRSIDNELAARGDLTVTRGGATALDRMRQLAALADNVYGPKKGAMVDAADAAGVRVDPKAAMAQVRALREEMFGNPDLHPSKELLAARAEADDIIARLEQKIRDPEVIGISKPGVAAQPVSDPSVVDIKNAPGPNVQHVAASELSKPVVNPDAGLIRSPATPTVYPEWRDGKMLPRSLEARTAMPRPGAGMVVNLEEPITLRAIESNKKLLQDEVRSTASGRTKPDAALEHDPVLQFKNRAAGVLADVGEQAVEQSLGPEDAALFRELKHKFGVASELKKLAAGSADTENASRNVSLGYTLGHTAYNLAVQNAQSHVHPARVKYNDWLMNKAGAVAPQDDSLPVLINLLRQHKESTR